MEKDTRKILALRDSEKEEPEVVEDFEEVDMDFADDMDFTRLAKMDSEKKEKSDNILLGGLIESMNKIEEDDEEIENIDDFEEIEEKCGDKKDYRDIKESIRRSVRRKLAEKKENVKSSKSESKKFQILNKFRKLVKESREENDLDGYDVIQKIIRDIAKKYRFTDDDFEEETLTKIFESVQNYLDMKITDEEYEALVKYFDSDDITWEITEKCGSKKESCDSSMKEQKFFRRGRSEKRKFGKH